MCIACASFVFILGSTWVANTRAAEIVEGGLPTGSRVDVPLRRGSNGEIELIDPTTTKGAAARRCTPGAICVGNDQTYRKLADALAVARSGDVIEIAAGLYRESVAIKVRNVVIRGVAGTPHFDCSGVPLTAGNACILLAADSITLENLDIGGAVISDTAGANGACVKNEPDLSFTLRRISCHGSQDGLLTNGGRVLIENSEFYDNGWTGQTHNVYLSGNCPSVTVRGSTFRDARIGHEFKSRCRKTEISDSVLRSTHGSRDLDIPDGGEVMVYRSTIIKEVGAASGELIGFAAESCKYPGNMILKGVTIVNSRPDGTIHNFDKCDGGAIVLQEVRTEGWPFKQIGYILRR